jgi:hypothetical protein
LAYLGTRIKDFENNWFAVDHGLVLVSILCTFEYVVKDWREIKYKRHSLEMEVKRKKEEAFHVYKKIAGRLLCVDI